MRKNTTKQLGQNFNLLHQNRTLNRHLLLITFGPQIFGQVCDQGFDQGSGEGEKPSIQCTVLPGLKEKLQNHSKTCTSERREKRWASELQESIRTYKEFQGK